MNKLLALAGLGVLLVIGGLFAYQHTIPGNFLKTFWWTILSSQSTGSLSQENILQSKNSLIPAPTSFKGDTTSTKNINQISQTSSALYQELIDKGYVVKGKTVYCSDNDEPQAIPEAEGSTFSILLNLQNGYEPGDFTLIAKDAGHVYFGCSALSIDPQTTSLIKDGNSFTGFIKDKNGVYYTDGFTFQGFVTSDGAHFQNISAYVGMNEPGCGAPPYAKDSLHVYDGTTKLPSADPNTFRVVMDQDNCAYKYAIDKSAIYIGDQILTGADPASYEIIGGYSKDKNHVYFQSIPDQLPHIVAGADAISFSVINDQSSIIGKDNTHLYIENEQVSLPTGIDLSSLEELLGSNSGAVSFAYLEDKNNIYYLNGGTTAVGGQVYANGNVVLVKVQNADRATFHYADGVISSSKSVLPYDAEDKNHKYSKGQIIQ